MKYEMATNSTKQVVKFSLGTCVTPPPPPLLPPLFWSIRHLQISHNAPYFPSKILQKPRSSQEKWKTNVMQNFGRQIRYITGDVVAYVLLFAPLRWLQTKYFPFFFLAEMWQCMKHRQVVKWLEFSMCIVTSVYESCLLQLQTFGDCCVTK